ncbi:MAG TPA: MFS transporter [Pseudonocardia sp.]|nr:MFS transporter [Pseudonocardia sp.]
MSPFPAPGPGGPTAAGVPGPGAGSGAEPGTEPGRPPATSAERRRFHVVVAVAGIGFGLTAPFTALLVTGLGADPAWAAYVVASMGISLLIVDFFGTRFVPRLGSRGALTTSMLVFGIGSLLSAVTTSWVVVGLARVLQGFGGALFMGGGVLLAVRLVRRSERGSAIGTFNAAWFAGIAAGPLGGGMIASILAGTDGLRLLFGVCALLNFVGAAAAWFLAPRLTSPVRPRLGLPRGLGVRGARAWSVLVLAGLGQAVRSGLALTLVPLLGEELGMGWIPLGIALFALALSDVAVMHFGAGWADRRGRMVPLALSLGWGALVTVALATVVTDPVLFALAALAVGATVGATWVLPTAMTVDLATDPEGALSAYRIASDVGMLAGGLLAGIGLASGGLDGALLGAAALLVAGLALTLAVGETLRPAPPAAPPPAAAPVAAAGLPAVSAPAPTSPPGSVAGPAPDLARESVPRPSSEEAVPLPPVDQFAVLAANLDITLTPERLAQAHAGHARFRPDLERLRALPLPFVEPVTEPATSLAWIANGGRP